MKNMMLVLQKLRDAKLYRKLNKCVCHHSQIEFFRYIISNENLLVDPIIFKLLQISQFFEGYEGYDAF